MKFAFAIPRATFKDDGRKNRPANRKTTFGKRNRRIIFETVLPDGTEHYYHATKGWRSRRA